MNGKTGALTQTRPVVRRGISCCDNGIPIMILAAILAIGKPVDLATNGTVLDERGFTSKQYKLSP